MLENRDNHPLHAGIHMKLAEIAAASSLPPPWHDAWWNLGPESTDKDRLAVYKAVRGADSVPFEAGFFLIAWMLDMLTDERAEEGLRDTEERLAAIRQKHGLDEEAPADTDDAPAEYREAMQQSHDAWDKLYVATHQRLINGQIIQATIRYIELRACPIICSGQYRECVAGE